MWFPTNERDFRIYVDISLIQPDKEAGFCLPAIIAEFIKGGTVEIIYVCKAKGSGCINQVDRIHANVAVTRVELFACGPVGAVNSVIAQVLSGNGSVGYPRSLKTPGGR